MPAGPSGCPRALRPDRPRGYSARAISAFTVQSRAWGNAARPDPHRLALRLRDTRALPAPTDASLPNDRHLEALPQKLLDGVVDLVLVADVARYHPALAGEVLLDVGLEAPASVGRSHLAEAEEVELGEELLLQQIHARLGVLAVAVLAVREVEEVHVPVLGGEAGVDDLVHELVGGGDPRAPALAEVVERVLVHLLGEGLVDDVHVLERLVLAAQPGVDPERGDAHDLLLLV